MNADIDEIDKVSLSFERDFDKNHTVKKISWSLRTRSFSYNFTTSAPIPSPSLPVPQRDSR